MKETKKTTLKPAKKEATGRMKKTISFILSLYLCMQIILLSTIEASASVAAPVQVTHNMQTFYAPTEDYIYYIMWEGEEEEGKDGCCKRYIGYSKNSDFNRSDSVILTFIGWELLKDENGNPIRNEDDGTLEYIEHNYAGEYLVSGEKTYTSASTKRINMETMNQYLRIADNLNVIENYFPQDVDFTTGINENATTTIGWIYGANNIWIPDEEHVYLLETYDPVSYRRGFFWSTEEWKIFKNNSEYTYGNYEEIIWSNGDILYFEAPYNGGSDKFTNVIWFNNSGATEIEYRTFLSNIPLYHVFPHQIEYPTSLYMTLTSRHLYNNYPIHVDNSNYWATSNAEEIRYRITAPPGWMANSQHEFDSDYSTFTVMVITQNVRVNELETLEMHLQIPAGVYQLRPENGFTNAIIVERIAPEYGGKKVYSICYSDEEMYMDTEEGLITTQSLDANQIQWTSWLGKYLDGLSNVIFMGQTIWNKITNQQAHGYIATIDFDTPQDALYVLKHVTMEDATYLSQLNAWTHNELCLGGNLIQSGGLDIEQILFCTIFNGNGQGVKNQNGEVIKEPDEIFEKDENGNYLHDENGKRIEKTEINAEDLTPVTVEKDINWQNIFRDSWNNLLGITNNLTFLPEKLELIIKNLIQALTAIAIALIIIKFVSAIIP